jgi:uncharacterized protein (DUF2062 family)
MRAVFGRHLFFVAGLLSFSLFFVVAGLERAGLSAGYALAGPMKVLIVPMYLVWIAISMALVAITGPVGLPQPFGAIVGAVGMVAGFAPYVLADYALDRWRRRRAAQ